MKNRYTQFAVAALLMVASASAFAQRYDGNCRTYIGTGGYYAIYQDGVAVGSGWDPQGAQTGYQSC